MACTSFSRAWKSARPSASIAEISHQGPNYRILANQWSRFTHYYFYIHDEVLAPIVMRVASFFPYRTTEPPTTLRVPQEHTASMLVTSLAFNPRVEAIIKYVPGASQLGDDEVGLLELV
jgi:hypothetical protein